MPLMLKSIIPSFAYDMLLPPIGPFDTASQPADRAAARLGVRPL
jgi:hypothetical protein